MDRVHWHPGEACPMLHSLAGGPQHESKRRAKLKRIEIVRAEVGQYRHTMHSRNH